MKTLTFEKDNHIATLTVNRPEKLNALNNLCMQEIKEIFESIVQDNDIRVVILTGAGDKAFVAGADISEFKDLDSSNAEASAVLGQSIFSSIENCGKPVIAAVNGFALGGGCELALAATFRLASDNAKFALPEVTLGLIPGYGGTQRLQRLIGAGRAAEMMVTGAMIDADKALSWGLVNDVVSQSELMDQAIEFAEKIANNAPLAVSAALTALNTGLFYGEEKGFEAEAKMFAGCFDTEDVREGTKAFLEKRRANFEGK